MRIYSLLTGRGNNTLKDKNILDILGHPVLYYPAKALKNSCLVNSHFCSSDDEKILNEAEKLGFIRIKRPEKISRPESQHIECILHGLDEIKQNAALPDILVVTLANNVTIKSTWIDDCIRLMLNNMNISAVVPVYKDNDHHPLRAKIKNSDGSLSTYDKSFNGIVSTNRQDLTPCYFLAHNFIAFLPFF